MSLADLAKLVFVSAIWGSAFIFLRVAVPEMGMWLTSILRASLASVALVTFTTLAGLPMQWRRNFRHFAIIGFFGNVVPFVTFSFAALHIPAAHSAVLNSTVPLFGALLSVVFLAERLTMRMLLGLLLGIAGVAILVGAGSLLLNAAILMAVAVCLLGAMAVALASIIVKKTGNGGGIHPIVMAAGSLALGSAAMLPALPFSLPAAMPSSVAWTCTVAVALVSTGLAQAMFISLILKIGPTRAMSATFLLPLFSMLWGILFLREAVGAATLIGAMVVLAAMGLVLTAPRPQRVVSVVEAEIKA
ncbi:DMT family transporter [Noviherbaspirillum sedimenti]|uniref:DMT family transporter n=1 Tax=Noviherbaspirillum sedimenti TaxID=2320865 RepID=A0A3A3GPT8_9BURK|nr:DMT family transporter [Noviherbaspirillum sedimenti]RJG03000.1 DMT family transporter [Noviherbaspirillum sedimenti]